MTDPSVAENPDPEGLDDDRQSWWISWYSAGAFEYRGPWWVSGFEAHEGGRSTICAAVRAGSSEEAKLVILAAHDDPAIVDAVEWRFVDERPAAWDPFASDRFPRADWMEWPPPRSS